jgi:formate dehydrogenase major subunit
MVEVEGYGLVSACSASLSDGMAIRTQTEAVVSARKNRLAALLKEHYGDCVAPCSLACPAGIDIQGFIALIARGAYSEAAGLIREALPLPAVIGRVCPHPCEDACRRSLVDQPIAICSLKRFAGDADLLGGQHPAPAGAAKTGLKVAIVGSGPAGLSAAYYLAREGHEVTVFESLPEPGGMLRYGIPDYRLPRELLDREIAAITGLGVELRMNQALGRDFTIKGLLDDGFRAVFLAIGAHQSTRMKIEGENLEGVLSGIDYLRSVTLGETVDLGKRVAVIGGGNTAIDAARTALRLGAENVTIVYRRSRSEMPAASWEIEEAEEEGVHLRMLAAPIRLSGNGRVSAMELIAMRLGEPDASGRRRPEPIPGSETVVTVDSVIAAIGQSADLSPLEGQSGIETKWGNIVADPATLLTGIKGVFAGGDCVSGAATAVEAVAAGRRAAQSIDRYLRGHEPQGLGEPYNITRGKLRDLAGRPEFTGVERRPRQAMPRLRPDERRTHFEEIEFGFPEDAARREAERCLECGCKAAHDCVLRELAAEHEVAPVSAAAGGHPLDKSHPTIERDPNKCISCGRCARICQEVQGVGALSVTYRVGTSDGYGGSLLDTTCESCGQCVASCPVGALVAKKGLRPAREVKTVCPYCGVGCGIYLGVRGRTVVRVRGDRENPINHGNLCVKGRFGYDFIGHPKRLTTPLVRRDGRFVETTWEEALDLVAEKLGAHKGDRFALVSSARCTNEENYVIQKFGRAVMGTNNIDHCARLCHAPSVAGLAQTFGSGAMTNSIGEIEDAACILAIGTNTTAAHPVIGLGVKKAVRRGAKLVVANPRRIDLCRYAHIWLQHQPGTDVALLMGMMRIIVDEGLLDQAFIEARCDNFDDFRKSLAGFDLPTVERITGVPAGRIAEAARTYAGHSPASILYSMGITQHSHGTDNVLAVSNLALLTGNIGKPSSGVNPLRGQNNVQGACDMGALPVVYPGYQKVDVPEVREKFEKAWGASLSPSPGITLTEMFQAAQDKEIRALYIIGENPVLSEPDAGHVKEALGELDFLVVQDIFLTETAELADVVLPAASFAEKDGTFTNTERRVQRIRKAVEPVGVSRPDWWIVCEIARRMGAQGFEFADAAGIMEEAASLTPSYGGITYGRLEAGGLQWPCPSPDHPGTPILHTATFPTAAGRARFVPLEFKPPMETPDDDYPLVLTTERSLYHYHTGTMTRRVSGLNVLRPEELVEMNPRDALELGISGGEKVRVVSRRGSVTARAKVTEHSPPGVVSMTFHFAESPTNVVTNPALDPVAKIPELKVCAVRVERAGK